MQAEAIVDRLLESGRPRRIVEAGVRSFLRNTVYGPAHRVAAHLKTLELPIDVEQIALEKTNLTPIGWNKNAVCVTLRLSEYRWIDGRRVLEPLRETNRQKIDRAIKDFFIEGAWRVSARWYDPRDRGTQVDIYAWPKQQRYPAPIQKKMRVGDRVETAYGPVRFGRLFGYTIGHNGTRMAAVYWDDEVEIDWLRPESIRLSTAPTSQG